MSRTRSHIANSFSGNVQSIYKKILQVVNGDRFSNECNIKVDNKCAGIYNAVATTNIDSIDYEVNGASEILDLNIQEGNLLNTLISRTVDEAIGTTTLYNSNNTYNGKALDFVFQGGVTRNLNAYYDNTMFLLPINIYNEGAFTKLVETQNIKNYEFRLDTGSGFSKVEFPFTASDGDSLLLIVDKESIDLDCNIVISEASFDTVVTARKSPYGIIPYCSAKMNGIDDSFLQGYRIRYELNDATNFHIGFWVYLYDNETQCFFTAVESVNTQGWYVKLKQGAASPKIQFQLFDDFSNSIDVESTEEIPLKTWCYVSIGKTGLGAENISFKLGNKDTRAFTDLTPVINSNDSLGTTEQTLGITYFKDLDNTKYYSGRFDNVHFADVEVTEKEKQEFFNNGWAGTPESLSKDKFPVFFKIWRLPEPYIKDFSDYANDAAYSNNPETFKKYYRETLTPFVS